MWEDPGRDTRRRLTVAEAADALGITVDAVRSRVKRRTIAHEREGGRVYVLLGADEARPGHDQDTDQVGDQGTTAAEDRTDELIATLREQLQAERQAHAEARRIIAGLVERIPAIEAPQEASEASEASAEVPETAEPRSATGGVQQSTERPQQRSGWRAPVDKLPWRHYALGLIAVAVASGVSSTHWWYDLWVPSGFLRGLEFDEFLWTLLGFESLEWIVPGIFGFWVGLKRRNLGLWRDLVPTGVGVAAVMVLASIVVTGLAHERVPNTNDLIGIVVLTPFPALIFYVSGATIGRALQRRTAGRYASSQQDIEAALSGARATPGDSWSPRKQAILGFAGTVVAALISLFASVISAIMSSGG